MSQVTEEEIYQREINHYAELALAIKERARYLRGIPELRDKHGAELWQMADDMQVAHRDLRIYTTTNHEDYFSSVATADARLAHLEIIFKKDIERYMSLWR